MAVERQQDLTERVGPMVAKELRQSLRRGSFVIPYVAIQVLAVVMVALEFQKGHSAATSEFMGALNPVALFMAGPFWCLAGVVCMLLMPMAGLVSMGQELDEGNHELLLLTKLSRWKIVFGKFLTLWGLSALTFVSLLPYLVVRYLAGGVEWWNELAYSITVLGGAAMFGAGAIGASAFRGTGARVVIWMLFVGSMLVSCAVPLITAYARTNGFGALYHINALTAVPAFVALGLALARAKLRLAYMAYEVKPANLFIGWLVAAPFVCIVLTLMTGGFAGFAGFLITLLIALKGEGRKLSQAMARDGAGRPVAMPSSQSQ